MQQPNLQLSKATHWHLRVPNKLLNLSLLATGLPRLETLANGPFDLAFLPNLNIVGALPRCPYVLTIHDLSWKIFPEYYSPKMRAWHRAVRPEHLIAGAAAIIVPSEATKRDLVRTFATDPSHIHVIPHGYDPRFSPHPTPQDHGLRGRLKLPSRFALFLGTLEPRKNLPALIRAMRLYRAETRDDLHLVLAGAWGWNSAALRRELKDPEVRGWVHVLGYVADVDRPALYRAARVLVWPSIYEGFGLPVLESMASGTPVITSHTSSLPELTSGAAILVDPFDPRDLVVALRELAASPELATRLRETGLERAKAFSWERTAAQTREVFTSHIFANL